MVLLRFWFGASCNGGFLSVKQQDTHSSEIISESILTLSCGLYIIAWCRFISRLAAAHSSTVLYSRVSGLLKLSDWQFLSLYIPSGNRLNSKPDFKCFSVFLVARDNIMLYSHLSWRNYLSRMPTYQLEFWGPAPQSPLFLWHHRTVILKTLTWLLFQTQTLSLSAKTKLKIQFDLHAALWF